RDGQLLKNLRAFLGSVAIEPDVQFNGFSHRLPLYHALKQFEITIPPPVLKNHYVLTHFSPQIEDFPGFCTTGCEGLLDQNVLTGIQCLYCIVYMGIVWCIDDNELNSLIIKQVANGVITDNIGVTLLRPLLVALYNSP